MSSGGNGFCTARLSSTQGRLWFLFLEGEEELINSFSSMFIYFPNSSSKCTQHFHKQKNRNA